MGKEICWAIFFLLVCQYLRHTGFFHFYLFHKEIFEILGKSHVFASHHNRALVRRWTDQPQLWFTTKKPTPDVKVKQFLSFSFHLLQKHTPLYSNQRSKITHVPRRSTMQYPSAKKNPANPSARRHTDWWTRFLFCCAGWTRAGR